MSASLRDSIQRLAASFAAEVLGAIRGSSLEEILAETSGGARRGPGRPRRLGSALAAALGDGARPSGGRGGRLGRRSAVALERVVGRIVDLLSRNPKGLRAEQIRAELGLSAKELPRPIAKALESKRLRKVGQKRATTYFAAGAGTANVGPRGGKKNAAKPRGRRASKKAPGGSERRGPGKKPAAPAEASAAATGS